MPARYAILAWGSLIWDLDDLAPHVEGTWRMAAGPMLPLEFSRISPKRRGALVLCLDPAHGDLCRTNVIASERKSPARAMADLAARERAPLHHVGVVCLRTGLARGAHGEVVARVAEWCRQSGWDGAVWTDLPSNFHAYYGAPFSLDRAKAHLRRLEGASLAEAVRYVEEAPPATDTPLRRALRADRWWRELRARHGYG